MLALWHALLQNSHRLVAWALEQGGREAQDALVEQLFKVFSPPATILLQHRAVFESGAARQSV